MKNSHEALALNPEAFQNNWSLQKLLLEFIGAVESRYNQRRQEYPMGGRQDSTVFFSSLRTHIETGDNPLEASYQAILALKNHLKQNFDTYDPSLAAFADLFIGALMIALPSREKQTFLLQPLIDQLYHFAADTQTKLEHTEGDETIVWEDDGEGVSITHRQRKRK